MTQDSSCGDADTMVFPDESMAQKLRGVQHCLISLQQEVREVEDPLLARIIGCAALLAAERATEYEEGHPAQH